MKARIKKALHEWPTKPHNLKGKFCTEEDIARWFIKYSDIIQTGLIQLEGSFKCPKKLKTPQTPQK